ncbi:MspA family porin [Gordonia polyisoprenivorans]|uniref:MspA family porin n=1 Tax=Gordonia polyisoprenivorans TaxID=84595 RepID=UPI0019E931D3|nr:MspA family porin [Gordonia polyisoprenivorans]MBE7194590.1 MspA family porin [Gordonia polyisoprenivorans]WCB38889.1 MspA family porin [Gordonia polyisoprenivorans]
MTITFKRLIVLSAPAAIGAAAVLSVAGVAAADVHVALPSQTDNQRLGDGTVVTVTRTGETANINPSLGGTPLHRNAWVSASYEVHTSTKAKKIKVQAGYIVGCQINISGASGSGSGGDTISTTTGTASSTTAGAGGQLTIGPGQAANVYVNDVESADDFGADKHSTTVGFKGVDSAKLSYVNETIQVNGCGGYAQARSYAKVTVVTANAEQITTFYGKPFSLG